MSEVYYAGIGSRQTPPSVLDSMIRIAKEQSFAGWTLRSGGASGADSAFERGARDTLGKLEIFYAYDATKAAILMAQNFHPAWDRCTDFAQKLHGRNMMILLGRNLDAPVSRIICWTPYGAVTGGTGLALRAAAHYRIPVRNLYFEP